VTPILTVVVVSVAITILLASSAYFLEDKRRTKAEYDEIIAKLKAKISASNNRPNTVELTEFLSDISQHGYTYTRVDPINIFVKSPRDQ